jgi:hypothetical protein
MVNPIDLILNGLLTSHPLGAWAAIEFGIAKHHSAIIPDDVGGTQ